MKLKYKKMVIIASIVVMALGFVALVFLDNGSPNQNAQTADLNLNENKDINKLIENYFNAKKSVNMDALSELVSDPSRIPKDRYTILASYVENYKDFDCYCIKNEEMDSYRVYVKYNMKLKNIESWVPCLTKYYVKITSEGKYVIYFSALDNSEVEFINLADKNEEIQKLKQEVKKRMPPLNSIIRKCKKRLKRQQMVKVLPHHRQHQLRIMEPQFQALLRVRHQVPFRVQVVHQQQTDKRK